MRWYVLQVLTGKEVSVCKRLNDAGFVAAVPQELRLIRKSGSWIEKLYTLFSSYVFVQMQYCAELYHKILMIHGVTGFLKNDNTPAALSYLEAEYLKQLINNRQPIKPAIIRFDRYGNIKAINGVMNCFRSRIVKYDRHARKARIKISLGGTEKEIELSAIPEDESCEDEEEAAKPDTG